MDKPRNRLAEETSPYLQQHAANPVDWYPWGPEALEKSRRENKPILLSIGYSACHWCHVMAHESFEDEETASLMNQLFVNIKVDREERPDLDQIYQALHGMITQRNGGWPLTMFLGADQTPFFAGTYFPKTARHGLPGFKDVLSQIAAVYQSRREDIDKQSAGMREVLARIPPAPPTDNAFNEAVLDQAMRELKHSFDEAQGGLGGAPKFPRPVDFAFCLERGADTGDDYGLAMARLTLTRMAEGGIYDQIGGGFSRYAVDDTWTIPHFEKMLYDNALLLALYTDQWRRDPQPWTLRIVAETAAWVLREMQAPIGADGGGYYSSLDADSEHEEGKFYVWTPESVKATLTEDEYAMVAPHYGLTGHPNFEGHWHLRITQPLVDVAQQLGLSPERAQALLDTARAKLFGLREQRIRPGRDEKILTSWNALMITGMTRAARVFEQPAWLASARAAADFIKHHLWQNQRLLVTHKNGKSHLNAYLDDYAFLLEALLELLQADFRAADLQWAQDIAEVLIEQFEDREHGGFFFTGHDHEPLIQRVKNGYDNATPTGNGIAVRALLRLGHLTGEVRYLDAAERTLRFFRPHFERAPSAHVSLCAALAEYLTAPTLVILRGDADTLTGWQRALAKRYLPHTLVIALPGNAADDRLPAALNKPASADPSAWVCQGTSCLAPMDDLSTLLQTLTPGSGSIGSN